MVKQVLVFTKNDCPRCPRAEILADLLREKGRVVRRYDIDTVDGLAEASFYGVMATPTIIIVDDEGEALARWRGVVPAEADLLEFL